MHCDLFAGDVRVEPRHEATHEVGADVCYPSLLMYSVATKRPAVRVPMDHESVFRPMVAIPFVMILGLFVLYNRLCWQLRSKHESVWMSLGQPWFPSFDVSAMRSSFVLLGFVLRRRHATLGDKTLSALGDGILALYVAIFGVLILFKLYPSIPEYGATHSSGATLSEPTPPPSPTAAHQTEAPWQFFLVFGFAIACLSAHMIVNQLILRRIETAHPAVWRRVFRPDGVFAAAGNRRRIGEFLRSAERAALGDHALDRLARWSQATSALLHASAGLYFIFFVILFLRRI